MASFFVSPPSFVSHPITRTRNYFSSSQTTPPPQPQKNDQPSQPQTTSTTPTQQLSANSTQPSPPPPPSATEDRYSSKGGTRKTTVESTDWIASSLTRRFGIGAGLAWVGFLAAGVVSEQIKTRFEVSQQEANTRLHIYQEKLTPYPEYKKEINANLTKFRPSAHNTLSISFHHRDVEKEEEVVLPNGIRYYELRVGGGPSPRPGNLVVVNVKGSVQGSRQVFVNTFEGENKRPLALVLGSRPYSKGICEGIEYVLAGMKAGGKRRVIIPPSLGFGEECADLGEGLQIPPFATLEYEIEVDRVSIAPA